jgi:(p)ppGpp synthase/HD superfamily hydrolase
MRHWSPDRYLKAWNFASRAHLEQRVPGTRFPYINHVGSVAMEIVAAIARDRTVEDPDLAVQCALLHDVIEDTATSVDQISKAFGEAVAKGVLALSKDPGLPSKEAQMRDSLTRILAQPREIWMVKLADRITNLQTPPKYWSNRKIEKYHDEAKQILIMLGSASSSLSERLNIKLERYKAHFKPLD